ncbi:alpha/beta hydrolase [Altericroceibacterium spongiae]|uniref:Alpha/beta hydrolase n=1 Tax=Altericroceibacterium spongiae TaxID=2320269 RepID=A0A420EPA0_9SPHN|nr:alpha/beta hydrolase [Altericroceibacterium spongiae]RKF22491.1 alpha/beta hydrolase [Altericroceibacterium spongiae]
MIFFRLALCALAIFALYPAKSAFAQDSAAQSADRPVIDAGRFSVEVTGSGPDVVLIPGLATPRDAWQPLAEELKSHYRFHLIQIKGFGEPAGPNASGELLGPISEDLARYIVDHNLQSPALVGHSMGGLLALMVGANHPDLPSRIMAVDGAPFYPSLLKPGADKDTMRDYAARLRDTLLSEPDRKPDLSANCPEKTEASPDAPGSSTSDPRHVCQISRWMDRSDTRVDAQAMYEVMTTDWRPRLKDITVPVTVLYATDSDTGLRDSFIASWTRAYDGLPQARLIEVQNSHHFIMLDHPVQTRDLVEAFLEKTSA